ncbi:hypothetical protein [Flavobacterium rhizosphaerae]|uniref:Uncharacterized protein n=1 Tax=Flavobacterium rhizosphaerae TaxID=3163298 RepID=A0ABW8YWN2_9FLAO
MAKQLFPLSLAEEQLKAVSDLAAVNYSPEKIALYLGVDKKLFLQHWYDHDTDIRIAYDGGQLEAEFLTNQKQLELAKSGNITAAQIYFKEAEKVRVDNIRKQILFGGDEGE